MEITAYFVISEALTNVCKHANASQATVRVCEENQQLVAEITDDGRGHTRLSAGFGLTNLRAKYPDVGLLMLSAHMEPAYLQRLLAMEDNPRAVGYLGKIHLGNLDELIDAFHRSVRGGTVIDSEIINQLMSRHRVKNPLEQLTAYQRRILGLVAEGHSNLGIAQRLDCKISNVEQHLSTIFDRLGLAQEPSHDRRHLNPRVRATLAFLRNTDGTRHPIR